VAHNLRYAIYDGFLDVYKFCMLHVQYIFIHILLSLETNFENKETLPTFIEKLGEEGKNKWIDALAFLSTEQSEVSDCCC
jgi:hypothetical protein